MVRQVGAGPTKALKTSHKSREKTRAHHARFVVGMQQLEPA